MNEGRTTERRALATLLALVMSLYGYRKKSLNRSGAALALVRLGLPALLAALGR